MVTLEDFRESLAGAKPAANLSVPLQASWWAGKDDWDTAHKLVMGESSTDAAWVHAYLHRVEGDLANARYWYAQAGKSPATNAIKDEWAEMAAMLLRG